MLSKATEYITIQCYPEAPKMEAKKTPSNSPIVTAN